MIWHYKTTAISRPGAPWHSSAALGKRRTRTMSLPNWQGGVWGGSNIRNVNHDLTPLPTMDLICMPYSADCDGADPRRVPHYMVRWVSTTGEKPPWSETARATIAA